MRIRRSLVRCLLACVMVCSGCGWWQDEFFSLDRAAPPPEQPSAASAETQW